MQSHSAGGSNIMRGVAVTTCAAFPESKQAYGDRRPISPKKAHNGSHALVVSTCGTESGVFLPAVEMPNNVTWKRCEDAPRVHLIESEEGATEGLSRKNERRSEGDILVIRHQQKSLAPAKAGSRGGGAATVPLAVVLRPHHA